MGHCRTAGAGAGGAGAGLSRPNAPPRAPWSNCAVDTKDGPAGHELVRDDDARRYSLVVDGELAGFVQYRQRGQVLDLFHTEIQPALQGRGLGTELVRRTLGAVREQGRLIVPSCPMIESYLADHPADRDLIAPAS